MGILARLVWSYVPELPGKNILVEPEGRSMAASLIVGKAIIYLKDLSAVVAVLRADHVNLNKERFLRKFRALEELAARGRYYHLWHFADISCDRDRLHSNLTGQDQRIWRGEILLRAQI